MTIKLKFKAYAGQKFEFTPLNDHFKDKHNAEVGLFLQALNNIRKQLTPRSCLLNV
jgi:hypothetical protein